MQKNVREKTEDVGKKYLKYFIASVGGIITGICNGLFGGGGGMVVVPFLTYFLNKDAKTAHATAILIILPITLISAITYLHFQEINYMRLIPVSVGVFLGGLLGSFLLPKCSNRILTYIFAGIMIFAGAKMAI